MSKPKVTWEAPPPKVTGRQSAARRLAMEVASRPNQWARIAVYKKYTTAHERASAIRRGKLKGWDAVGTFQVEVREIPEGWGIWVKCTYVKKGARSDADSE